MRQCAVQKQQQQQQKKKKKKKKNCNFSVGKQKHFVRVFSAERYPFPLETRGGFKCCSGVSGKSTFDSKFHYHSKFWLHLLNLGHHIYPNSSNPLRFQKKKQKKTKKKKKTNKKKKNKQKKKKTNKNIILPVNMCK